MDDLLLAAVCSAQHLMCLLTSSFRDSPPARGRSAVPPDQVLSAVSSNLQVSTHDMPGTAGPRG